MLPPSPSLLIHNFFRKQNFCETQRGSPTKFYSTFRNKFSIENGDFRLLGLKDFETRNFLKQGRFPRLNFLALWEKNLGRKIFKPPLLPLSSKNLFATAIILKHSPGWFLYHLFWHCETKQFPRKFANPSRPLLSLIFFNIGINKTLKDSATHLFGTLRQKTFGGQP